jgi:threonine dehydrogenase-like Zn-dependent dehydrogenase
LFLRFGEVSRDPRIKIAPVDLLEPRFPLTPGHEFSGEIVELGSDVTGLQKGQRATASTTMACGKFSTVNEETSWNAKTWTVSV